MRRLAWVLSLAGVLCACGSSSTMTVTPPAITVSISPSSQMAIDQGQSLNFTATVVNDSSGKGVTWTVSGTGCTGAACGSFSNITTTTATYNAPTAVTANMTVTITATSIASSAQMASSTVAVTPAPSITPISLAAASVGTAYSATLQATGGVGTLTWSLASGSLPPNLTLSSSGTISGIPTATGTYTFTVMVTDASAATSGHATAQMQLSLVVRSIVTFSSSATLTPGMVNLAYSQAIAVSGGAAPYTWSITSGALPAGVMLVPSSGVVQGTPTMAGTFDFTVMVADSISPQQTQSLAMSLTINTLAAACGGSGSEAMLAGQYAFSLSGYNSSGYLAVVGSFTADGAGDITGGEADTNGALGTQTASINTSASSYVVGANNLGCAAIMTSFGVYVTRFALGSVSAGVATKGRIIEWDNPTANAFIAAGEIAQQTASSFSGGVSGSFALHNSGWSTMVSGRVACAGVMTAGGGSLSNIEEDCNNSGTVTNASSGTGTISGSFDSSGRGIASLTVGGNTSMFTVYMVSSSNLLMVNSDANLALSGAASLQNTPMGGFTQASLSGASTFYLKGLSGTGGGKVQIGIEAADGIGTLATTTFLNAAGFWERPFPTLATCTYTVASNGRASLSGAACASSPPIIYLTNLNAGLVLATDIGASDGPLTAQVAGPITDATLSGTFYIGTAEVVSQASEAEVGVVTLDGAGGISFVSDTTSTATQSANASSSDTYAADANGTFTTGSSGITIVGLIYTSHEFAMINSADSVNPTINLCLQ